jgi:tight adherence protein C
MSLLIALLLFLFVAGSISAFGYHRFVRQGSAYGTLAATPAATELGPALGNSFRAATVSLLWLGEKIPISPQDASITRRFLMGAGYRSDNALPIFYGIKVTVAAALLIAALLSHITFGHPLVGIIVPILAAALGFAAPGLVLDMLVERRRRILRLSLPDALDLLVVCVEAGLGLDQAIRVVSDELNVAHPELSQELALVSLEMRAGTRRTEALTNMGRRTGEGDIKKLVAVLIQSDRFGTSMADALRTHSQFMRTRRRQLAQERANKIGVKMIFPIFFLILPSVMLVAVGPALLQLHKNLLPLLHEFQLK